MRTRTAIPLIVAACIALLSTRAYAQFPPVDVGSNGSYGPIEITANTTLDLPEDGIFHATTVSVAAGATLTFNRNARNTPVFILATGDIVIDGTIDIRGGNGGTLGGLGGPGGFDGGNGASSGSGPGGGLARLEGVSTNDHWGKRAQLSSSRILIPLIGGSGGGGLVTGVAGARNEGTGGGGGGAVLLASNSQISLSGTIDTSPGGGGRGRFGGFDSGGRGGHGAVRLVAPTVSVSATQPGFNPGGSASGGAYFRIDAFEYNETEAPVQLLERGTNFVIFPDPSPRLEVIEIAGETVDPSTAVTVVHPPAGSDPNTTMRIRAENFGKSVPISIVLQPEVGARTVVETTIDNSTENPVEQDYNITLPVNLSTRVFVWTR